MIQKDRKKQHSWLSKNIETHSNELSELIDMKKISDEDARIKAIIDKFKETKNDLTIEIQGLKINELFFHEENIKLLESFYFSELKLDKQIYIKEIIGTFKESGFLLDSSLFRMMKKISNEMKN
jgi:hypothetical protein